MTARSKINRHIFGLFLEAKRIARGLTRAAVAKEADVPIEAVRMAVDRLAISKASFRKLCAWQGEKPEIFYGPPIPKIVFGQTMTRKEALAELERAGEHLVSIGGGQ